jgi:hypothetical protein
MLRRSRFPVAATAQLISVLHEAPQPAAPSTNSTLRNRYRAVETEDEDEDELEEEEEEETVESMGAEGWKALGGSFAASAGLTVSATFVLMAGVRIVAKDPLLNASAVPELALPRHLRDPCLRHLRRESRQRMALVILPLALVSPSSIADA